MKITLIDWLAWGIIKFTALIQGTIFDYLLPYARSDKEFWKWMQYSLSGYHISRMRIEELPDIARKMLLWQGRIVLLAIVLGLFLRVITR